MLVRRFVGDAGSRIRGMVVVMVFGKDEELRLVTGNRVNLDTSSLNRGETYRRTHRSPMRPVRSQ